MYCLGIIRKKLLSVLTSDINKTLSPYLTGMETSWRPVGDSSLRGSRRRRRDVSWRFGGSRRSRSEIKHVRFFLRLFGDFFKSPVGLGDVAATKYVFKEQDVSVTSPQRRSDVSETWSRPNDWGKVATTSPQRRGDVSMTRRQRLRDDDWPTFIDLERKLSKKLKLVYTCKTWYMMYIDKICTRKFLNID